MNWLNVGAEIRHREAFLEPGHGPKGWTRLPLMPTAAMIDASNNCLKGINIHKAARPHGKAQATKADIRRYKVCMRWWAMIAAAPLTEDSSDAASGKGEKK